MKQWATVQLFTQYDDNEASPSGEILNAELHRAYRPFIQDLEINTAMPAQAQRDIKLENQRRKTAREIYVALTNFHEQRRTLADLQAQIVLVKEKALPKLPPEIPSTAPCVRFNEIIHYLSTHIVELAIDTMNGPIPEHVLLNYIIVRRELRLDADEWRAFLYVCNDAKAWFRYDYSRNHLSYAS